MEARFSFIEPQSETTSQEAELAGFADETVVQNLISAGVVTHEFRITETFDAMFALSELYDLPEISFVAAFRDGAIYLGCPDDPPESIADLVRPVSPSQIVDRDDVTSKLNELLTETQALRFQLERRDDANALSKSAASRAAESQTEKMQVAVSEFREGLNALSGTLADMKSAAMVSQAKNDQALDALRDHSEELIAATSKLDNKIGHLENTAGQEGKKTADAILNVQAQISELTKDDVSKQLALLTQDTFELGKVVKGLPPEFAKNTEVLKQMQETISALDRKSESSVAAQSGIETLVNDLTAKLDTLSKELLTEDTSCLIDQLASALEPRFSRLEQELIRLRSQPKQEIDLTEQRRGFAAFMHAMGSITKRLEAAVGTSENDGSSPSQVLESLGVLPDRVLASVMEQLEFKLNNWLDARNAQITDLHGKLDDLTSEIAALDSVPQTAPALPDMDSLEQKIDTIKAELSGVPDVIETRLAQILQKSERHGLDRDLTAQRQSFARFGAAMGNAIGRLEHVTETRETLREELKAVLEALPATLHAAMTAAPAQNSDDEQWRDGLEELLSRTSDLANLRASIDSVVRRPDPVPDLSEHRRSFARFATAMTTVMNRLEGVADKLTEKDADAEKMRALALSFETMSAQLCAMADVQSSQLIAVQAQLSANASNPFEQNDLPAQGLESMRFLLAEQVALKLRQNRSL